MTIFVIPVIKYANGNLGNRWSIGKLARNYDLNFTALERFGNKLIALDSIKNKLLFLKQMNNRLCFGIINLMQVESCIVRKVYGSIESGGLNKRSLDYYLENISLHLGLKSSGKTIALPFYEKGSSPVSDIPHLERKANGWAKLLSGVRTLFPNDRPFQTALLPG